jgi:hypothetical protein
MQAQKYKNPTANACWEKERASCGALKGLRNVHGMKIQCFELFK